jgi:hypothetical protein
MSSKAFIQMRFFGEYQRPISKKPGGRLRCTHFVWSGAQLRLR